MAQRLNKWAGSVKNDVGEQNYLNQQLHESRIHPNRNKQYSVLLKQTFEKAITDFVVDGEEAFARNNQVQEQENMQKGQEQRAVFEKTEIKVGAEHVTAKSETDAALIEMMKDQQVSFE